MSRFWIELVSLIIGFGALSFGLYKWLIRQKDQQESEIKGLIEDVREASQTAIKDIVKAREHREELDRAHEKEIYERLIKLETREEDRNEWINRLERSFEAMRVANETNAKNFNERLADLIRTNGDLRVELAGKESKE